MKTISSSDQQILGFQIAPMIDVVFVIMLFFMVMAGAIKAERYLPGKLPGIPGDAKIKMPDVEILLGVSADGTITLNDEPFDAPTSKSLPALTATLQRLKAAADQQKDIVLVTVQAEQDARYERVVDALNAIAKAQIANVTFAVNEVSAF